MSRGSNQTTNTGKVTPIGVLNNTCRDTGIGEFDGSNSAVKRGTSIQHAMVQPTMSCEPSRRKHQIPRRVPLHIHMGLHPLLQRPRRIALRCLGLIELVHQHKLTGPQQRDLNLNTNKLLLELTNSSRVPIHEDNVHRGYDTKPGARSQATDERLCRP